MELKSKNFYIIFEKFYAHNFQSVFVKRQGNFFYHFLLASSFSEIKSSKERDVHADRSGDVEKNEKAKTAVLENGSRATKEELNEGESDLSERF